MRSVTLPPDLATIAREAARIGTPPAPPRTATVAGLGHCVPVRGRHERRDRRAHRRRRRVDRQAHRRPRPAAAPRRARA